MPAPLVVAAATIGGTLLLGGTVSALKNANNGLEKDSTSHVTPEAMTPAVDTRAPKRGVEMIQHEVLSRPGMRVRVVGTIDNDHSIAKASEFGGGIGDILDNREPLNDGKLDDIISSKLR